MNRQHSLKPTLSVDLKKKRIRIHKVTLHLLGDPEYIQLLVNPLNHTIALRKCIQEDYLAHRIRKEQLTGKNCYELYSTDFVNTLCKVNTTWDANEAYRIYGVFFQNEGLVSFDMNATIPLSKQQE